jgi:hypothetical protein
MRALPFFSLLQKVTSCIVNTYLPPPIVATSGRVFIVMRRLAGNIHLTLLSACLQKCKAVYTAFITSGGNRVRGTWRIA